MFAVLIAHLSPFFQYASLAPASTNKCASFPAASRAAAIIFLSSDLSLVRPKGPQPILKALNPIFL